MNEGQEDLFVFLESNYAQLMDSADFLGLPDNFIVGRILVVAHPC